MSKPSTAQKQERATRRRMAELSRKELYREDAKERVQSVKTPAKSSPKEKTTNSSSPSFIANDLRLSIGLGVLGIAIIVGGSFIPGAQELVEQSGSELLSLLLQR